MPATMPGSTPVVLVAEGQICIWAGNAIWIEQKAGFKTVPLKDQSLAVPSHELWRVVCLDGSLYVGYPDRIRVWSRTDGQLDREYVGVRLATQAICNGEWVGLKTVPGGLEVVREQRGKINSSTRIETGHPTPAFLCETETGLLAVTGDGSVYETEGGKQIHDGDGRVPSDVTKIADRLLLTYSKGSLSLHRQAKGQYLQAFKEFPATLLSPVIAGDTSVLGLEATANGQAWIDAALGGNQNQSDRTALHTGSPILAFQTDGGAWVPVVHTHRQGHGGQVALEPWGQNSVQLWAASQTARYGAAAAAGRLALCVAEAASTSIVVFEVDAR